jgi:hypothetical protein
MVPLGREMRPWAISRHRRTRRETLTVLLKKCKIVKAKSPKICVSIFGICLKHVIMPDNLFGRIDVEYGMVG